MYLLLYILVRIVTRRNFIQIKLQAQYPKFIQTCQLSQKEEKQQFDNLSSKFLKKNEP